MNAMVVRAAERHRQTGQTSGMVREEAFHAENTWAGVAYNAPRAVSASGSNAVQAAASCSTAAPATFS